MAFSSRPPSGLLDRRLMLTALMALPLATGVALAQPTASRIFSRRISVRAEGTGSDVLLLPGLGAGPTLWADAVAAAPGHRWHYIHVRGFAGLRAEGNAAGTGPLVDALVDEIIRYCDAQKLTRIAIAGHSMGGAMALMIALRRPDLAGKLMVVDMLPAGAAMVGGTASGVGFLSGQLYGYLTGTMAGRRALGALLRDFSPSGADNDPHVIATALKELAETDLTAELPSIRAPLTVVYAVPQEEEARVAVTRRYREAYAGAAHARLVSIGPSGHMVMADQPEKFARIFRTFLS